MQKSAPPTGRPTWSGSISFGLVTIPVKLYNAVREKRLSFRSLHDQDKVPLKQKLVCPADGKDVHPEHIVKGYEIEKDRFVVMQQEELDAVAPKASKAIEIQDFVALDEIDPVYFDRPYYVVPTNEGMKPYRLLVAAMEKSGRVGISTIVMHGKQYLSALRPLEGGLCLETMHFSDEVVAAGSLTVADAKAKVDDREMKIAQQLIDSLTTKFKPEKYHDEYREKVLEMIDRKAHGQNIVTRPESPEKAPKKGSDLIAALEASLAKARGGGSADGATNGKANGTNGHAGRNGHNGANGHNRPTASRRRRSV
jgi:DNA end-binding protein Ku